MGRSSRVLESTRWVAMSCDVSRGPQFSLVVSGVGLFKCDPAPPLSHSRRKVRPPFVGRATKSMDVSPLTCRP